MIKKVYLDEEDTTSELMCIFNCNNKCAISISDITKQEINLVQLNEDDLISFIEDLNGILKQVKECK